MPFRFFSTAASRPRRRTQALKPSLDGLEARLVLSHGVAHPAAAVHVLRRNKNFGGVRTFAIPISINSLSINDVTGSVTDTLTATGTLTGKLLGQSFTTPVTITTTGTGTSGGTSNNAITSATIALSPVTLNLRNGTVTTGPVRLRATNLTSSPAFTSFFSSLAGSTTTPTTQQLNSLLNNPLLLSALNTQLAQSTSGLDASSAVRSASKTTLTLSFTPTTQTSSGAQVTIDDGASGPVVLTITSNRTRPGRSLSNLISDVARNARGSGRFISRVARDLNGIAHRLESSSPA